MQRQCKFRGIKPFFDSPFLLLGLRILGVFARALRTGGGTLRRKRTFAILALLFIHVAVTLTRRNIWLRDCIIIKIIVGILLRN